MDQGLGVGVGGIGTKTCGIGTLCVMGSQPGVPYGPGHLEESFCMEGEADTKGPSLEKGWSVRRLV